MKKKNCDNCIWEDDNCKCAEQKRKTQQMWLTVIGLGLIAMAIAAVGGCFGPIFH